MTGIPLESIYNESSRREFQVDHHKLLKILKTKKIKKIYLIYGASTVLYVHFKVTFSNIAAYWL